jgi:hydroxypyruvate reductase
MDRAAARELLLDCFRAGLAAVDPEAAVRGALAPIETGGRITVLALGKAAPAMTRGAAAALGCNRLEGIAVSNHVDEVPAGIELLVGGHPVPSAGSLAAGRALLELAGSLGEDDLAVVLISGGGSALAEVLVPGVALEDLAATNELLLRSGANIRQTNMIRKRLSRLKGGRLAAAIAPARLVTLVVSDVVGDPLDFVASGPTVPSLDPEDAARAAADDLGITAALPPSVVAALQRPLATEADNAIRQDIRLVATGSVAAHAAAARAEELGFPASVIDTRLEGDAATAAGEVLARATATVSVFAGETTVNVTGSGRGGRNQEAALAAATLIDGRPDVFFFAAGTDGIDGTTSAAGAIVDGTTLTRSRALCLSASAALDDNDSGTFFERLADQIMTGPTGTNVGDLWLVLRTN